MGRMAGPPFVKGAIGQNADFSFCLHSGRVRSTSDLRSQRTGSSSQLGTRRFDGLHPQESFKTILVDAGQERYYRFPTACGGITPLLVSKWLLSATAMIPTPRQLALISPLAICTFPYNKNSGYDSRQGTSKSINTNYLRKRNSADGK